MSEKFDVAVVGGGPAGLAAALRAQQERPQAKILLIEREHQLGGILKQCIHNGFGLHRFGEELTGPEYADRFIRELGATAIQVRTDAMVLSVSRTRVITLVSPARGLETISAGAIVLAMGCRERTRGALLIPGTRPAGVYTAGCAQRMVNMEGLMPGKRVVILGSGDIGLIMARRMTWEGAHVEAVLEIMPESSGLARNIAQCLNDNHIPLHLNHTVTEIHGRARVEGVTCAAVDPATRRPIPGTEKLIPCDTLLLSVGLIPENELTTAAGIEMDRVTCGAVVDETRQTSLPGVFACGNVLHVHDLVDNVSAEAELAGAAAARYALDLPASAPLRRVIPDAAVRYVVPQRIHRTAQGPLDLYFRVSHAVRPATVTVCAGDAVLFTRKKPIMTPGEMEKITVSLPDTDADITVRVE